MSVNGVPLFQPLLCDHVFAMGVVQKEQLGWLGNDQVLATGFPRFDTLQLKECRVGPRQGKPKLLLSTANTPWVTPEQQDVMIVQFRHLIEGLQIHESQCNLVCRIARELGRSIGCQVDSSGTAIEALNDADAFITTPSTMAVEAILLGVPTLIFDPFANPAFTPLAWNATHWESVLSQLPSLLSPAPERASYQDWLAKNSYPTDGLAGDRIASLIELTIASDESRRERVLTQELADGTAFSPYKIKKFTSEQIASMDASLAGFESKIELLQNQLNTYADLQQSPSTRSMLSTVLRYAKGIFR
jgi:hypothetical protein